MPNTCEFFEACKVQIETKQMLVVLGPFKTTKRGGETQATIMEALSVRRLQISIRGRNGAVFQVGLQSQRLGTRFRFPLIGTREAYLAVGSGLFEKHTHWVAKGGRLLFCVFSFSAFSFFFAQVSLGIIGWPATFFFTERLIGSSGLILAGQPIDGLILAHHCSRTCPKSCVRCSVWLLLALAFH